MGGVRLILALATRTVSDTKMVSEDTGITLPVLAPMTRLVP